jgi:serine protease inhibitor
MADPILEAQADFALNLLREVSKQGQTTTIVSPISVAIALSMVYAGAKDETAEQMNKLLANGLLMDGN